MTFFDAANYLTVAVHVSNQKALAPLTYKFDFFTASLS